MCDRYQKIDAWGEYSEYFHLQIWRESNDIHIAQMDIMMESPTLLPDITKLTGSQDKGGPPEDNVYNV